MNCAYLLIQAVFRIVTEMIADKTALDQLQQRVRGHGERGHRERRADGVVDGGRDGGADGGDAGFAGALDARAG